MSLLQAKHLVKDYGSKRVVEDISIEVGTGEVVGLLGPNGAGKSTTFKMMVGRIKPTEGRVLFKNRDITTLPMYERAKLGIAYLAQEPSIFDGLNVRDNLLAILEFHEPNKIKRMERLEVLMNKLALTEHAEIGATMLSGGLRRRLEITRALICEPQIILLDEPFAGVDPIVVEDIQAIVELLRKDGLGVLITDHNVGATLRITSRAYIIQNGSILISGTAAEIAKSEIARREYLGKNFNLHSIA